MRKLLERVVAHGTLVRLLAAVDPFVLFQVEIGREALAAEIAPTQQQQKEWLQRASVLRVDSSNPEAISFHRLTINSFGSHTDVLNTNESIFTSSICASAFCFQTFVIVIEVNSFLFISPIPPALM